jgi:hypothetical protein
MASVKSEWEDELPMCAPNEFIYFLRYFLCDFTFKPVVAKITTSVGQLDWTSLSNFFQNLEKL